MLALQERGDLWILLNCSENCRVSLAFQVSKERYVTGFMHTSKIAWMISGSVCCIGFSVRSCRET